LSKKIVIISNYYPPEMGAAANRIKNLAQGLKEKGNEVTIICPLPNYPEGKIFKKYRNKFFKEEVIEGINVKRFWIFPSKSKKSIIRLFSMLSFAWSFWFSIFSFIRSKPDLFIIQSPPLFVGLSGLIFSKVLKSNNVLNVSDIWPLSALELGVIKRGFFYSILEKIEKINYKLADKIVGQSKETITHINTITTKKCLVYRNVPSFKKYPIKLKEKENLKIVYAGLLGFAQGILKICEEINFKDLGTELHIYGAGMDEQKILEIVENQDKNIFFHGRKTATEIKKEILKYDVGFVPLKNKIYGAVPSKIFELMQLGTPILFYGEGEGAKIVMEEKVGFATNSDNITDLENRIVGFKEMSSIKFKEISLNSLKLHEEKYNLENQLNNFMKLLD